MTREEIVRRLKRIADHAIHSFGEKPYIISLDDGIALNEAIEELKAARRMLDARGWHYHDGNYWSEKAHKEYFEEKQMKDESKNERDCDHCVHHVWNENGFYTCEKWTCNYEKRDTK